MAGNDPQVEAQPLWPECSRCQKIAKPGVACDRKVCPFRRIDGVISW